MSKIGKVSTLLAVCFIILLLPSGGTNPEFVRAAKRPNIIFILTDDLDTKSINKMTRLYSLLADRGTTFENAFVSNSTCCPSRSTILRGQYAHNHGVLTNAPPNGGYERFRELGNENSTIATWLHDSGYRTALIGKYLNGYSGTHVPPGWDEWDGVVSHGYFDFQINENGEIVSYSGEENYQTDVLRRKANQFIRNEAGDPRPFFLYLATRAPHGPTYPAPRHKDTFAGVKAPRPLSFNEKSVSDKPVHLQKPLLTSEQISKIDKRYRGRLQTLLAVDEMIGRLVKTLRNNGELDNTYIVFTSDNGFHMGQHRFMPAKGKIYEEDIRVPLIIRGPGVPRDRTLEHMTLNTDFAPTFAELAGVQTPSFVDGRSLVPLLSRNPPDIANWRSAFLVEHWIKDSHYKAVRTRNHIYVEYSNGEHELYNLNNDPYELHNRYAIASPSRLAQLESQLDSLRDCAEDACRTAEDQ